jgi:hypothetical protein
MAYVQMTHSERVEAIMAFEGEGVATDAQILKLFSNLIGTGLVWTLQGAYGRRAIELINAGLIDSNGNISQQAKNEYLG